MASPVDNRTLPKKEHDLFRSLIKCYEEKQYKKGLKNADTILKKFPNHGETQAMKGLIFNNMGKKEESYELVKLGLKNDVRSHVCWHVFGLLYRTDRNYKEAIKCYLNALRIDTDNQNILRDLSFLQIQMRDMNSFAETRRKLLTLKPTNKIHWISYAVGLYTSGNYRTANDVLEKFLQTSLEERVPYEQSELYLFQNLCLETAELYPEALEHLQNSRQHIVDLHSWNIKRGELLIKLEQYSEALEQWTMLLDQQPDNYYFHCGYQICLLRLPVALAKEMLKLRQLEVPSVVLDLTDEQLAVLRTAYQASATPKASSTTRIFLSLFPLPANATQTPTPTQRETEEEFKRLLGDYIQKGLRKGIPNLYNDICALIRVPDHRLSVSSTALSRRFVYAKDRADFVSHPITAIALNLIENYILTLSTNGTFEKTPSESTVTEVPTTLLWSYYLRSHLLGVCGRNDEALKDIELSIDHTPTSLDSLAKRARILKNCGDYFGASEQMNYCRSLDLQDRFVNNKATKYYLRANRVEDAMNTIAMFTKHDGDPQQTLFDLQCIWYELEAGESYARQGSFGPALKKFYAVEKHFTDFVEDQFDFHAFSIRKTTLRAYLDMIETSDSLFAHKFFQRAGQNVLEIMLKRLKATKEQNELAAAAAASAASEGDSQPVLTAAERKKEKNKQKKLAKKEENAATAVATAAAGDEKKAAATGAGAGTGNKKGSQNPIDEDPNGTKILEKDILEECSRWCHLLTKGGLCKDSKTLALVCEVMLTKDKYILALRCLTTGLSLDPTHPLLNYQLICFVRQFYGHARIASDEQAVVATEGVKPVTPVVIEVVCEKLQSLLGGEGPDALSRFIESYIDQASLQTATPLHRVMAAKAIVTFQHGSMGQQRVASLLLDDQLWSQRGVNYKNISSVFKIVESDLKDADLVNAFKQKIQERYPRSELFNAIGTPIYKGVLDLETTE